MKKSILFTFIAISFLLVSCKSKKIVTEAESASSTRHLIELMQQAQPDFTTMNAGNVKVSVNMGERTYSTAAALKMITDSVIVFSVYPFLGMEMFSLELYPDRWVLYDKMNTRYVTDNYQFFSYRYGINISFQDFQAIFSAQFFELGGGEIDYKKYKFVPLKENKHEIIFENERIKQISRTHQINTLESVSLQSKTNNYLLTVQYSDYAIDKGVNYPHNIAMNMLIENAPGINLNMVIQKVSFNGDVKLSPVTPERQSRYTKTTIDQILTK